MDRESGAVLPFATEVLTAPERAALGERMAAGRLLLQALARPPAAKAIPVTK
jgi:hypothetical protein